MPKVLDKIKDKFKGGFGKDIGVTKLDSYNDLDKGNIESIVLKIPNNSNKYESLWSYWTKWRHIVELRVNTYSVCETQETICELFLISKIVHGTESDYHGKGLLKIGRLALKSEQLENDEELNNIIDNEFNKLVEIIENYREIIIQKSIIDCVYEEMLNKGYGCYTEDTEENREVLANKPEKSADRVVMLNSEYRADLTMAKDNIKEVVELLKKPYHTNILVYIIEDKNSNKLLLVDSFILFIKYDTLFFINEKPLKMGDYENLTYEELMEKVNSNDKNCCTDLTDFSNFGKLVDKINTYEYKN